MPGPAPKDSSLRQRRNKTATAAKLSADHEVCAPELPPRLIEVKEGETVKVVETAWHKLALSLWEDVWSSPMAPEYLEADYHGLYVLVALTDSYWRRMEAGQVSGANELAKEIRLQRQAFGLSPIDRRRLQWEVERSEEASEKGRKRRARKAPEADSKDGDPRLTLVS
jgi:hypothetical protein